MSKVKYYTISIAFLALIGGTIFYANQYDVFNGINKTITACVSSFKVGKSADTITASVEIYTLHNCPYCDWAKQLLTQKGVSFKEYNLSQQPELRATLLERTKGRMTVPQIFIDGQLVGGYVDLKTLDREGKLGCILTCGMNKKC